MSMMGGLAIGIAGAAGLVGTALIGFTALNSRRAERLVPAEGRFVDVAGARLHYTDQGAGPAVVLVHGLGGQWRNFASELVDRLALTHRVIVVDRPGSGYSTVSGLYPGLSAQAEIIARFMDKLGVSRPLLVGHSLGGALALALALNHPNLLTGLALIAPLTHHQERAPGAFRMLTIKSKALRRLIAWTLVAPAGRLAGSKRREVVFAPDPLPADFETRGGGLLVYRPQGFEAASLDLQGIPAELPTLQRRYQSLRLPISILFGSGDQILDPAEHGSWFVSQAPHTRLTLVPGGHMLPFTAPATAADWIESVFSGPGP